MKKLKPYQTRILKGLWKINPAEALQYFKKLHGLTAKK
tara:strand:- start:199 stop:312 length:114 start_codon:yes stop_codon:yes gene_type:complete